MRCWAAALFGTPCSGRFDQHHLIKYQILKREGVPERDRNDPRILRIVCRAHHGNIHSANFHLWKTQLPSSVLAFAREHGLEHLLDEQDARRRETEALR